MMLWLWKSCLESCNSPYFLKILVTFCTKFSNGWVSIIEVSAFGSLGNANDCNFFFSLGKRRNVRKESLVFHFFIPLGFSRQSSNC